MKIKTLLILSIFLLAFQGFAQQQSISVNAGLSLANADGTLYFKEKFRIGALATISYEYKSESNWLYSIGLGYQQKGVKVLRPPFDPEVDNTNVILNKRHDYITIPLLIGYSFGNKLKSFTHIGLAPSYNIHASFIKSSTNKDYTDETKKFELDALVDVGMRFAINTQYEIVPVLQFQHSLTDHYDTSNWGFEEEKTSKHYSLNFLIGLRYNL